MKDPTQDDRDKRRPLFEGLSSEEPTTLTISFAADPAASLGVQLSSHDNGLTNEMFVPGYASVGGLVDGPTLARQRGVRVGDILVAASGEGYRRFPPDFPDAELVDVTEGTKERTKDLRNLEDDADPFAWGTRTDGATPADEGTERQRRKGRVVKGKQSGEVYEQLLLKIRDVKAARLKDPARAVPLVISLERYAWDSRVHAWSRFLSVRRGNVPAAMTMVQGHKQWRNDFFPVDVTEAGVQRLLRAHAVSSIEVAPEEGEEEKAPVVYIDFSRLQEFAASESDAAALDVLSSDAAKAFVLFTETLLS